MRAFLVTFALLVVLMTVLTPGAVIALGVFCLSFSAAAVNQWGGLWRVMSRGKLYDWE